MSWKNMGKLIGYILRHVEVLLCLRKTPYKTHIFPKKNARCEYYYNIEKFKKPYA
tara:strand:+ start:1391 stop:1555 length:165 start_codon:yes stop_codon:yes gene_type:complete